MAIHSRSIRIVAGLVLGAGLGLVAPAACAQNTAAPAADGATEKSANEPTPWDQKFVSEQADQIFIRVGKAYDQLVLQADARAGSGDSQSYLMVKDRLRVARNEAQNLKDALAKGKGRQDTVPTFDKLMTMLRDARNGIEQMYVEAPLAEQIEAARTAIREIAPYYDPALLEEMDKNDEMLRRAEGRE